MNHSEHGMDIQSETAYYDIWRYCWTCFINESRNF